MGKMIINLEKQVPMTKRFIICYKKHENRQSGKMEDFQFFERCEMGKSFINLEKSVSAPEHTYVISYLL